MAMPRNLSVRRVVALVVALAKLHNFCIDESDIPEHVPQTFYRDRFHMMNADSGYVTLRTDDPQQNTAVPTELIHGGEHFEDVPDNQLRAQRRRNLGVEFPRTRLFQLIADGHWQRPIMRRGNAST
jgi:hypothetical protein